MRCELLAERVKVPALDVIQVIEHDFQLLRGVVWDLVDRGSILVLLRQHRYAILSFLKTRCFVSLVMQKTRICMRRMVELAALGKGVSFLLRVLIFSKQSRLKAHVDVRPEYWSPS
jgi:hypothetical protein